MAIPSQLVLRDSPQPTAKTAALTGVKSVHAGCDRLQYILHDVSSIGLLRNHWTYPAVDQWRVDVNETVPRIVFVFLNALDE